MCVASLSPLMYQYHCSKPIRCMCKGLVIRCVCRYAGACLARCLLPPPPGGAEGGRALLYDCRSPLRHLVATCCPLPALKFLEIRTAPLPPAPGGVSSGGAAKPPQRGEHQSASSGID